MHSSLHRRSQRCRAQPEQKLPEGKRRGRRLAWPPQLCTHAQCPDPQLHLARTDVQFQLSGDESQPEMQYDEETKTLKVPLSALEGEGALRRTKLVVFTCNKCGEWLVQLG